GTSQRFDAELQGGQGLPALVMQIVGQTLSLLLRYPDHLPGKKGDLAVGLLVLGIVSLQRQEQEKKGRRKDNQKTGGIEQGQPPRRQRWQVMQNPHDHRLPQKYQGGYDKQKAIGRK